MTENVIPRIPQLDYDPEWGDLFGAAFRRENFVGSAIQQAKNSSLFGEDDPTPVTDTDINLAVDQAKLAPFIEHFTQVSTRGELNRKIAHIRQQAEDKAILDKGGWSGFGASLVAGVLDVPTLVPFGHAVRLGRLGTESLKTTSSKLAMMAALDATATETGLQLTQDLREMEESALTVGGSVVLTTLLGTGIARYLSRRHFDDLSKRIEVELPKIADGRAEIEVADQFAQASANTARAIAGERIEPQLPMREFAPGERARAFLDEQGIKPGLDDVDNTIGLRSLLIDADGAVYDLNRKFATHADWMRAVDDAGDNALSGDMANVLQATLSREIVNGKPVVTFATGSQSPLTRKQLRGIRELAKMHGVENRDLYVRESRNGDVEVLSLTKEQAAQPQFADFQSLSRYESAENRARAAEKAGAPPMDPELRQGVPTTRWDGEATSDLRRSSGVAHKDSPVHLTREQFTAAVRRGMVGPAEPHNAAEYRARTGADFARVDRGMGGVGGMLSVRGGWDGPEDLVTHIYNGLAAGYRTEDIARHQAHLYALSTDAQYREDVSAFFGGKRGERPEITDAHISAAYDLMQAAYRKEVGRGTGQIIGQGGGGNAGGNAGGTGGGGGQGSGQLPPGGPPPKSIESEFAPKLTPSQMAFAESGGSIGATRGLSRLFGRSPVLELMNSSSTAARAWIMRVAELSGRTKGAYEGATNPIAVQSRMTEYEGMRAVATREFNDAYKAWRQGLDIMGRDYENFSRNVAQALVRWNLDEVDPNVARAARSIRETIATMYERAVEQGLIRKDAWKPGDKKADIDYFAWARKNATDTTTASTDLTTTGGNRPGAGAGAGAGGGAAKGPEPEGPVPTGRLAIELEPRKPGSDFKDVDEAVEGFVKAIEAEAKKIEKDPEISGLTGDDANVFRQIAADVSRGDLDLTTQGKSVANSGESFYRETGSNLARGGRTGDRGLDYSARVRFKFGPKGQLGDDMIQSGGLINRHYTDRMLHERDEFIRAETMAKLQRRDRDINDARKANAEALNKAREEARGSDKTTEEIEAEVILDPKSKERLWHELNKSQKSKVLMSSMNHAKGAWEEIVHGTWRGGDARGRTGGTDTRGRPAPLISRNVELSDEILLAKGWIDDDALGIMNHVVRRVAADVELARVFRRPLSFDEAKLAQFGSKDAYWLDGADKMSVPDIQMIGPRKAIGEEFDEQIRALGNGPENDAARNALKRERALVLGGKDPEGHYVEGLIDVVTDMIRGTHRISENNARYGQNLNATRSYLFAARMGANVLTSVGDLGAAIMNTGVGPLLRNFAVRSGDLVSSLADPQALANLATKWELPQERVGAILAREARAAGIAIETDLMSRMASQFDMMDPFRNAKYKDTTFRQTADWLARAGSKAYFINVWTNMVRKASYGVYVDRVIRAAMNPEQIAKHERVYLDDLGIDNKLLEGIRREVVENRGAEFDGGVWHMNHERWADQQVRSAFWAAGRKDANNANVSPTAVEKPLALTHPIGATLFQFWSFSFGATMRILGRSAQRIINGTDGFNSDGARTILGLASMVGLGMASYALHNYASTWYQRMTGTLDPKDELPNFSENWRQWTLQGMSRSGVLGVFSQINDVWDNIGLPGPSALARSFDEDPTLTDPMKRYGRPNAVKNLSGPTMGLIDDIVGGFRGLSRGTLYEDGAVSRGNIRAFTRNTPFINAFYLKSLTRELQEHVFDDVLQLPPDRK